LDHIKRYDSIRLMQATRSHSSPASRRDYEKFGERHRG